MIFITLGSQKFQFDRLLKAIDKLVESGNIKDEVFAQTGYSDYNPMNYRFKKFLDRDEFSRVMEEADIVITHGGTGAIIGAVKKNKKVIAVPRKKQYGEHVDNHQVKFVEQFEKLKLICGCDDCDELGDVIDRVKNMEFKSYQSNTQNIISSIDDFIMNK